MDYVVIAASSPVWFSPKMLTHNKNGGPFEVRRRCHTRYCRLPLREWRDQRCRAHPFRFRLEVQHHAVAEHRERHRRDVL
jgi:hypothetical protein